MYVRFQMKHRKGGCMLEEIGFRSYCWSVGTTSYRTEHFNLNIETQLRYMHEFKQLPQNQGRMWAGNSEFQTAYYLFLKQKGFLKGEAKRPDKDAREKTSGLVDIGLLNAYRDLTPAGLSLLKLSDRGDFSSDNALELQKDSFLYFKQMLKTSNVVDGNTVRPFLVFLYVISKAGYLTNDEFTYLLPLCINKQTTDTVLDLMLKARKGQLDLDDIILSVLMQMDNYKKAREMLLTYEIDEELICTIGINRKSKQYDKPYYPIYESLVQIVLGNEEVRVEQLLDLYGNVKKLTNTKIASYWRKYIFTTNAKSVIKKEGVDALQKNRLLQATSMEDFLEQFFYTLHLFKVKATLSDYFDLNRRYFKSTDAILFKDGLVTLDILPKCYLMGKEEELFSLAFTSCKLLEENTTLGEIAPFLKLDETILYENLSKELGETITDASVAKKRIEHERYRRFEYLLETKFPMDTLIELFDCFEQRADEQIKALVTDNADIPTIFEYILGISWYYISGKKGNVLDFMNLSLEADLLPKTHAGGGEADIVWQYQKTDRYPSHTLLLEATLADRNNQRRMEMEPVSRHLGDYLLENAEKEAYCIFVTTNLNMNVISDFRGRKYMQYYNSAATASVSGMKIIPIQTSEIKGILQKAIIYDALYEQFEQAYQAMDNPNEWYQKYIAKLS